MRGDLEQRIQTIVEGGVVGEEVVVLAFHAMEVLGTALELVERIEKGEVRDCLISFIEVTSHCR